MAKVLLVQPWIYQDEFVKDHDLAHEWRNGPYSLLLLASQLRKNGHQVLIIDMSRNLVVLNGELEACLAKFSDSISNFKPDIIGFGFFSVHYLEVKKAVEVARRICAKIGIKPLFIAGGIHASVEPKGTIKDLGFDYAFVGEADLGIVQLAESSNFETVPGVFGQESSSIVKGEEVKFLDSLPFPDWSMIDFNFYAYPSFAKLKLKKSKSLDMIMGRGCSYKCAFCAYNALSSIRFYSAGYLVEQIDYMKREFDIDGIYFTDSSIGNNRRLLREFCELMLRRDTSSRVEWYGNLRPNQVNEEVLKLMWSAGCRFLFYGFESGSQRVLDLMNKYQTIEDNYIAAELHNKLKFPYHASMILGYPGEREEDILHTFEFLLKTKPPFIGINCYVPLPGSPDYDVMKAKGIIDATNHEEWRLIGQVNSSRVYADIPQERYRELVVQATQLANKTIPADVYPEWKEKAYT